MKTTFESIKFEDLTIKNPLGESIFESVNYEFPRNEIVAIQGVRGSGKSTLLRVLAGLSQPPCEGKYLINNEDVFDMSFEEFMPFRKEIGYGFDYGGLISNKTIYENLMLPMSYHSIEVNEAQDRIFYYLNIFNLTEVKDERPALISGGMRKEACVVRAFMLDPEILILDDPTLGMSASNKQTFVELIYDRMRRGNLKHVYIATDDPTIVEGVATKMIYIKGSEIITLV